MKKIKVLLVVAIAMLLTGCWDKVEIEDKAIVLGVGIDLEDNLYGFTYAVGNEVKPSGEGEKQNTPSEGSDINTIKAVSLHGANMVFMRETPRKPNFEHLKVIIFGEELMSNKEKLEEILLELEKDYEVARTVLVFTTIGKASEIVGLEKNISGPIGLYLREIVENNGQEIHVKAVMLDELLCNLGEEREEPIELPNIYVKDDKPILE